MTKQSSRIQTIIAALSLWFAVAGADRAAAQEHSNGSSRINALTSAIDASGVRHRGTDYKGTPPWLAEATKGPPFYPYEARHLHLEGIAIIKCSLDRATGKIQNLSITKSSGSPVLDEGARKTVASWKFPAGKWKEVEIPVEFKLLKGQGSGPEAPRSGHKPAA